MWVRAICFDFGDTLADEVTEEKDATETTLRADLIPGARALVLDLRRRGYPLALVADGRPGTYRNVLAQHGIFDCFDALAISDLVGVCKPDPRMFVAALDALGVSPADSPRTVMVGNYLARDIKGANALGMVSVWLDWAPRRPKAPADASEVPAYTIRQPLDLLGVIEHIEQARGRA